jgi:hypothetical protein
MSGFDPEKVEWGFQDHGELEVVVSAENYRALFVVAKAMAETLEAYDRYEATADDLRGAAAKFRERP